MVPRNNDQLLMRQYGFAHAGQCLFLQRWLEMFNPRTLPTYQFRIHNSHGLLKEALAIIDEARSGHGHLEDILQECRARLEEDSCLKKHCGPLRGRLIANLKTPSQDERKYRASLLRLEYQIKHSLRIIQEQYLTWLFEDLKESIDAQDTEAVDRLSGALASELLNIGWLPQSLQRLGKIIFLNDQDSFDHCWQRFLQTLQEECQEFNCLFPIKLDSQSVLNNLLGLPILTGAKVVESFGDACRDKVDLGTHYIHVTSNARANDLNSAVMVANREILKKLAIINYFADPFSIQTAVIVFFPNRSNCTVYNLNDSWQSIQRNIDPNNEHVRRINTVLSAPNLGEGTRRRLLNFLRQYQLGITALSEEQWFSNLWIALESFVTTGQYGSIIEHVKQVVPAIHCQRYIYHLLKNFMEDCGRCNVTPKLRGQAMNTRDVREPDVEKILQVFRDTTEYSALLSDCGVNALLGQRCIQIHSALLNNQSVKRCLETHKNHLTWHLQRLYRVRNNLMHAADLDPNIFSLMIHLNHYVRAVFGAVIHQMTNDGEIETEGLFARFVDNYDATIDILGVNGSYDNSLVLRGALF